jgi:5-methyltetrahydropteroyltriglutamate--homocysteine methyltransferase
MKTSHDRILTTHVGSLPRTDAVMKLLDARENRMGFDQQAFDREVRQAVLDVVKRQAELGIDVVSDGETSKMSYVSYVRERLSGFSDEGETELARPHLDLAPFPDLRKKMALLTGPRRFKRVKCVGPIALKDREALRQDLDNLRAAVKAAGAYDAFMNAASPGVVASFFPNAHYPTHEAYIEAVANAMREEYSTIVAAGFAVQIDCPDLAMSRHTGFQGLPEPDFLKRAAFHVEALNHALQGVPAEMVRVHICWGNYEGPHTHDIDLRKIVDTVLRAKAQAFSVEAANPRHEHEWEIWKDVSFGDRILIPGVIDTSTNYVEHPELVAQRIERFANLLGRDRVIASTDCGFGTSAGHGKIDPEVAWLKLGALVEGARRASQKLRARPKTGAPAA